MRRSVHVLTLLAVALLGWLAVAVAVGALVGHGIAFAAHTEPEQL
jgi:hypothetical protein